MISIRYGAPDSSAPSAPPTRCASAIRTRRHSRVASRGHVALNCLTRVKPRLRKAYVAAKLFDYAGRQTRARRSVAKEAWAEFWSRTSLTVGGANHIGRSVKPVRERLAWLPLC
jgi:hypothetical protein